MNRLPRALLHTAKVLSLALCAATLALWLLSYFVGVGVTRHTLHRESLRCDEYNLRANAGRVRFAHATRTLDTPGGLQLLLDDMPEIPGWSYRGERPWHDEPPNGRTLTKLGFYHSAYHVTKRAVRLRPVVAHLGSLTFDLEVIVVPHWFLALLLSLPLAPAIFRRYRRWCRPPAGFCTRCGYDLRATPDRCPECGAVTTPPAPPTAPTGVSRP